MAIASPAYAAFSPQANSQLTRVIVIGTIANPAPTSLTDQVRVLPQDAPSNPIGPMVFAPTQGVTLPAPGAACVVIYDENSTPYCIWFEGAYQPVEPLTVSAWIAPTLINSWANFGSGFETAAYLKDPLGFVHLKGVITGGASTTVAFVLPAGYRPGATTLGAAGGGSLLAEAQAFANGDVACTFPATTPVGLSGITFLAEN